MAPAGVGFGLKTKIKTKIKTEKIKGRAG